LFTSPTTIATTYYILSQYENSKTVVEKIKKFRVLCSISLVDNAVVDKAILSSFNDFEDAIQYYSALSSQCDMLISRNEKDFKTAQIPVLNAMDFLKSLDKNGY
jgi:predicted nucleic acid-binding protein